MLVEAFLEQFASLFHFKESFLPLVQVSSISRLLVDLGEHFTLLDVVGDPRRHVLVPSVLHYMHIA